MAVNSPGYSISGWPAAIDPLVAGEWYFLTCSIVQSSYPVKWRKRYWNRQAWPAERTKPGRGQHLL